MENFVERYNELLDKEAEALNKVNEYASEADKFHKAVAIPQNFNLDTEQKKEELRLLDDIKSAVRQLEDIIDEKLELLQQYN